MSVNYGQPHLVDVPVTDLDDMEDDIIFNEQHGAYQPSNLELDSLDYEYRKNDKKPWGIIDKFKSIFGSESRNENSYEMVSTGTGDADSFEIEDEEESDERDIDLRDYKIRLLNRKLKKTTSFVVFMMVSLVLLILYFTRYSARKTIYVSSTGKKILSNSTHDFYPTTIVISLDGFHPHYINSHLTPTLHNMILNDYGAPYMTPSFPSSTFPNHWTLITGLYPSEHGIVGNTFYDPKLKKRFINTNPKIGGLDPNFWRGGEPIWTTAFKQGINSAVHMWPGSEVPEVGIGGGPLEVDKYNGSELLSSKVDKVMKWIDRENINKRPELILTYVPTIDQFGHKYGISGRNLTDALTYVDDFISLTRIEIDRRNLSNIVNLIVVSDHGMAPTSKDRLLYLDDLIDLKKIDHIDGWPLFGLRPRNEHSIDEIATELKLNFEKLDSNLTKNYKIYLREDLPKEWEFGGLMDDHKFNYRLAPIWIIPNVGYSITTHQQMEDNKYDYKPKGVHGYNNTELLMRAVFLGSGPYFNQKLKSTKKVKPFSNIEVYNLICDTLNLIPSPNNGTRISVNSVISDNNALPDNWTDPLVYPDLPFATDHIVKNSTYDLLWKEKPSSSELAALSMSTNNNPYESLISEESTFSSIKTVSLPEPTDFENPEPTKGSSDEKDDADVVDDSDANDDNTLLDEIIENMEDTIEEATDRIDETFAESLDKVSNWFGNLLNTYEQDTDKEDKNE